MPKSRVGKPKFIVNSTGDELQTKIHVVKMTWTSGQVSILPGYRSNNGPLNSEM